MAIVKDYLDPNAQSYANLAALDSAAATKLAGIETGATADQTATEMVTAINAGATTINADKTSDGTTNKVFTGTEQTKLSSVEANATADQTATEIRDSIVGLADDDRKIVISRPTTGQYKVYAIQKHSDGKTEIERNSVAS